ncbi:centrosome and spindle pole associated protein 1 isoform X4 [Coccinella septempunctata]|uniref:centrosome and spindle pole associated protein 1 isoform X4 n=1 Tax=Coccinella septempunctata TaxID=41139 RepID=UPI001D06768C|nr:centrosome and spindle pole associated protein 1 isoform X4 [Coccinella septempunctata]
MSNKDLIELLHKQKALLYEDKKKLGLELIDMKEKYDHAEDDEVEGPVPGIEIISNDKYLNDSSGTDQVEGRGKENYDSENFQEENHRQIEEKEKKSDPYPVEKLNLSHFSDNNEKKKRDFADQVASLESPLMSRSVSKRTVDQDLTTDPGNGSLNPVMDKPKGILTNRKTGSPRDRYMSNLKHTYTPSFMDGFSYTDRTEDLERERKKRETYNHELRLQIEEKRRLQAMKDEQERREQELENRRLEQQLLRMQEEALNDDHRSRDEPVRRHSDDYARRRMDLGMRSGFRKHTDSESSVLGTRNALSHYSPPVSRRTPFSLNVPQSSSYSDPLSTRYSPHSPRYEFDSRYRRDTLNRMDSLNVYNSLYDSYDTARHKKNAFARFDSLSRIDSLGSRGDPLNKFESLNLQDDLGRTQRRHSATQQDLSLMRTSPKLQRRSNSSRFDDQLPIPVLKAHSPVARELKNSIPFNSGRNSSEACRKLEDKWQIPAVQKNIVNHSGSVRDGHNRSILTQLGAIRMQLQQEQLRMDESLRKRGITQSKAVDFN